MLEEVGDRLRTAGDYVWQGLRFVLRVVKRVAIIASVVFGLLLLTLGGIGSYVWFKSKNDIENIPALTNPSLAPLPQPVTVYSADGVKLGSAIVQNRIILAPGEVPKVADQAAVAIEDQRFYEHRGVDFLALARAGWADIKHKAPEQGASTITMQYVRNVYLSQQKTVLRKLREAALALQLESIWTKQRILTAYLNTVYFGEGAYGLEAASRHYFGKHAKKLSAAQTAMLIGQIQNPSQYDPYQNPVAAKLRRNTVLDEMFYQGYLSRIQVRKAKRAHLGLKKQKRSGKPLEPLLFNYAYEESKHDLSTEQVKQGGYKIYTTFNMHLTGDARKVIAKQYSGVADKPAVTLAQVDPQTGRVVVLTQSKYKKKVFNLAAQALRQPGSAVKPFTLATYLGHAGQLADSVDNSPVQVKKANGDTQTIQPTQSVGTVLQAITFSQNPAFFRLYQQVGGKNVLKLQEKLGMQHMDSGPAAGIGGTKLGTSALEMASAYSAFANIGKHASPFTVARVEDNLGNTLYKHQTKTNQAMAPEVARRVNAATQSVVKNGLPQLVENVSGVRSEYHLAGKTGTSEDNADAWFVGYTPRYAAAVWTGFPAKRKSMADIIPGGVVGASIPAKVFNEYSLTALKYLKVPNIGFAPPQNLVEVPSVKSLSLNDAVATLQKYKVQYKLIPVQSLNTRPNIVLNTKPRAHSWISSSNVVQVTYSVNTRTVPDIIGKDYLTARRLMGRFTNVKERIIVNNAKPIGTVVAQYPLAGITTSVDTPIKVAIAVRRAPPRTITEKIPYVPSNSELANLKDEIAKLQGQVVVPNLLGLSTASSRLVLESLGLNQRSNNGSGIIQLQDTSAGTRVNPGKTVHVTVTAP